MRRRSPSSLAFAGGSDPDGPVALPVVDAMVAIAGGNRRCDDVHLI